MQRKQSLSYPHKTFDCRIEVGEFKELNDTGRFSGYASIFGNVDQGGDIVERGAFKEFESTKDGYVRVLYQHDMRQPIGKAKVKEDDKGLTFDAQLILSIAPARNAYEAMKAGILDGMSIGYDVLKNGAENTQMGFRRLTAVKLWEISLVTFGMNPLARVELVKQRIAELKTCRQFEEFLRDQGFTADQAKAIAAAGWKEKSHPRDEGDPTKTQPRDVGEEVKAVTERIARLGTRSASDVIDTIRSLSL